MKKAGNVQLSRAEIDRVLASSPSPYQLKCRANALQRLAEDCARFFPWPALQASLLADARRLRASLKTL